MGNIFLLFVFVQIFSFSCSQKYIQIIAGTGTSSSSGDGGAATAATMNGPKGVWADSVGNLYTVEYDGSRVRKISTTGIISTFGGTGTYSTSGGSGIFTSVPLANPYYIHGDQSNLYFSDDYRIWQYSFSTGQVNAIAGTGSHGYAGDGSTGTTAMFGECLGVSITSTGNLYIADYGNHRIRVLTIATNIINTYAGNGNNGFAGDGGPASAATLSTLYGVYADSQGNVYFTDTGNYRIRVVNSAGIISTFAGTGSSTFSGDGGPATSASFVFPVDIKGDSLGAIYIADVNDCRIRYITNGIIATLIGSSTCSGVAQSMLVPGTVNGMWGIWIDTLGVVYASQKADGRLIRVVDMTPSAAPTRTPTRTPTFSPTVIPTRAPSVLPTFSPSLSPTFTPTKTPTYLPSASPTIAPTFFPTFAPTFSPTACPTVIPTAIPTRSPTFQPSSQPSGQPSSQPTSQPISKPSSQPSNQPSRQPSSQPSSQPSNSPTNQPSAQPSSQPSNQPTSQPSAQPSTQPSSQPTIQPSSQPSLQPFAKPSSQPTGRPSSQPTRQPSSQPSSKPSSQPTVQPTTEPTSQPSRQPTAQPTSKPTTQPSAQPTSQPSSSPTTQPTSKPTAQPSAKPSMQPSSQPSLQPSAQPSSQPSSQPSRQPTTQPTSQPSSQPTNKPSSQPSSKPSAQPTAQPSEQPSRQPTSQPSTRPSSQPSSKPSSQPSTQPTAHPTSQPTVVPSTQPSSLPSTQPSSVPSEQPSSQPSGFPSSQPTAIPSVQPSSQPTGVPTGFPTCQPSSHPSSQPSSFPSTQPSTVPTAQPTDLPTMQPTGNPSAQPTSVPSSYPSAQPSSTPSLQPSAQPTCQPSSFPTSQPTLFPSNQPSSNPSSQPTAFPSAQPSGLPSTQPTGFPSSQPTQSPTEQPSALPTTQPSGFPSAQPTMQPSSQPTTCPSSQPSSKPTSQPSVYPSGIPSCQPSSTPSSQPSAVPSAHPSAQPTTIPTSQPTSVPSTQPSATPSVVPSTLPTIIPSSLPTCSPSSQPTAVPTEIPTSLPSSIPSSQPSAFPSSRPSTSPTSDPSSVPTARPTFSPTETPSSEPTRKPSSLPTGKPSSQPSLQPSSNPSINPLHPTKAPVTSSPTLALSTIWNLKLESSQVLLSSMDDTTISQRSTLIQTNNWLDSSQNPGNNCQNWKNFLSNQLYPFILNDLVPASLTTTFVNSPVPGKINSTVQCSSSQVSTSIVQGLLGALQNSSFSTRQYSCGSNEWKVKRCIDGQSSVPALCVNCQDPCSSLSASMVYSSCSRKGSPLLQTSFNLLSVAFADPPHAPMLVGKEIIPSRTSVKINLKLSMEGMVYVGVFDSSWSGPSSINSIILQNNVAQTKNNQTSVLIQGLQAAKSYQLYFVTKSLAGTQLSYQNVLLTQTNVTTLCCRAINLRSSSSNILEGESYFNLISLTVDYAPATSMKLQLVVSKLISNQLVPVNQPGLVIPFSAVLLSPMTSAAFSLSNLTAGQYLISLSKEGQESSLYSIKGTGNSSYLSLTVSRKFDPLPAPVISSVRFSDDGTSIYANFDSNTNMGGLTSIFSCKQLFNFSCVLQSKCQWTDSKSIVISIAGGDNCIKAGDSLSFSSLQPIRAACPRGDGNCFQYSTWPAIQSQILKVQNPLIPLSPKVMISMSSIIGQCAPLVLDLTSSTGNGGRSWKSVSINVQNTASNASALQNYLKMSNFDFTLPIIVPYNFFEAGSSYNFLVTLCNFLGACSSASQKGIAVSSILPTIRIPGSSSRSMKVNEVLALSTVVTLSRCADDTSQTVFPSIDYKWTVLAGTRLQSITSASKDPSKFLLPASSLTIGTNYVIQVSAGYNGVSSSTSIQVSVEAGDLIAFIDGGSSQAARVGSLLTLDGSKSYDQNQMNLLGSAAGLSYSWSCTQLKPSLNGSCWSIFDKNNFLPQQTASALKLVPLSKAENYVAQVTMTIQDASKSRMTSSIVTVTVIPALTTSIVLQSSAPLNTINPGQSIQLTGLLSVPDISYVNVSWSTSASSGLDLASAALTPVFISFLKPSTANVVMPVYLKLSSSSLQGGLSYAFTLSCQLPAPGSSSSSSIVVKVNSPPKSGRFLINPSSGLAFSDFFTFSCSQWQDENLPLTYQFGLISTSGIRVSLVSLSEISYKVLQLPGGERSSGWSVSCVADVFDSLKANTTIYSSVIVKEQDTQVAAQLQNYFNQSSSAFTSNDASAIKQVTGIASYLLNKVNCSLAPNCSVLNRQPCSKTAQTCGSCLSDSYLGVKGDSNEKCYRSLADIPSDRPKISKVCGGNGCSGHGVGQFKSLITSQLVSECNENDLSCVAVCSCDAGYSSSAFCDMSDEEVAVKRLYRDNLLQGVQELISMEDVSDQSISDWVNSLTQITQNPRELSSSSIDLAVELTNDITALAAQVGNQQLTGLLDVLDSTLSGLRFNQGQKRRLLSSSPSSLLAQDAISRVSSLLASSMIPDESPYEMIHANLRVHLKSVGLIASDGTVGGCKTFTSVTLPQSSLEKALELQPNTMLIPACGYTMSNSLQIAASSMSNEVFENAYNSDPLSLSLSSFPCRTTNCSVEIVLRRDNSVNHLNETMIELENSKSFNTSCEAGDYARHDYSCPNAMVFNVTCKGKRELIQSHCPKIDQVPSCNRLSGLSALEDTCEMIAYTAENITCSCSLLSGGRRRLSNNSSSGVPSGEVKVDYVSMLGAVTGNFESTVLSAGDLNASMIARGWQAMVTIGTLFGGIIISMVMSHFADKKSERIESMEENAKSKASGMSKMGSNGVRKERAVGKSDHNVLQMAEESLPQILGSRSFTSKVKNEIKRHHRWFGVIYHYSHKLPRLLRVVSLATNIIIMLFVQSLTYDLTNGNDGTCERLETETSCLQPRSAYATGQSKCYWTPSSSGKGGGSCAYIQPDNSIEVILFVAIFSALISTPFALLIDRIIVHILAAPNLSSSKPSDYLQQSKIMDSKALQESTSIIPRASTLFRMKEKATKQEEAKTLLLTARSNLDRLVSELCHYRTLLDDGQRQEFDDLWGLDAEGNFKALSESNSRSWFGKLQKSFQNILNNQKRGDTVGDMIFSELEVLESSLKGEKEILSKEKLSEREKGKRLLFLFQKDLMPGINGMILESKNTRDELVIKGTSRTAKILSWMFLGSVNLGMLFYVLLFALSQDTHRQGAWGQSFALWLIVEVFLVSSVSVFIMHVFVPSLLMKDVGVIKKKLLVNVVSFYKEMALKGKTEEKIEDNGEEVSKKNKIFNSAEYLFLSNRMAHLYPEIKIAKMILSFQTPWPKQSYQHITDTSKKYDRKFAAAQRSVSIIVLFFLSSLLSVPISMQDMIIHMVSTTAMGYTLLLHLRLYQIFPVLVIIPTIFFGIVVHFVIQSNKSKKEVQQSRLLKDIAAVEKERRMAEVPIAQPDTVVTVVEANSNNTLPPFQHKARRESLKQGIAVAKQLENLLSGERKINRDDDDVDSVSFSDDYMFSSEEDSSFSSHHSRSKSLSGKLKHLPVENLYRKKSHSPTHRQAFAAMSQRFMKTETEYDRFLADAVEKDEDDDELFNLHLAVKNPSKQPKQEESEETNDDDDDDVDDNEDNSYHQRRRSSSLLQILEKQLSTPRLAPSSSTSLFAGNRHSLSIHSYQENSDDQVDDDEAFDPTSFPSVDIAPKSSVHRHAIRQVRAPRNASDHNDEEDDSRNTNSSNDDVDDSESSVYDDEDEDRDGSATSLHLPLTKSSYQVRRRSASSDGQEEDYLSNSRDSPLVDDSGSETNTKEEDNNDDDDDDDDEDQENGEELASFGYELSRNSSLRISDDSSVDDGDQSDESDESFGDQSL